MCDNDLPVSDKESVAQSHIAQYPGIADRGELCWLGRAGSHRRNKFVSYERQDLLFEGLKVLLLLYRDEVPMKGVFGTVSCPDG